MPFPEVVRVKYKNNPLDQVICQLRFPPILRIDSEIPAKFQEKIRTEFPNYTPKLDSPKSTQIKNMGIPPDTFTSMLKSQTPFIHEFETEDQKWLFDMTRTTLSLSTINYVSWEEFLSKFEYLFKPFIEIYDPANFNRIGLRYIDVIVRSKYGLVDIEWNNLLNSSLLGIISSDIGSSVKNFEHIHEIELSENAGHVRIVTNTVNHRDTNESCIMIDSDFAFQEKTKIGNAIKVLDDFHTRGFRLFKWCIKEKLHKAMELSS